MSIIYFNFSTPGTMVTLKMYHILEYFLINYFMYLHPKCQPPPSTPTQSSLTQIPSPLPLRGCAPPQASLFSRVSSLYRTKHILSHRGQTR